MSNPMLLPCLLVTYSFRRLKEIPKQTVRIIYSPRNTTNFFFICTFYLLLYVSKLQITSFYADSYNYQSLNNLNSQIQVQNIHYLYLYLDNTFIFTCQTPIPRQILTLYQGRIWVCTILQPCLAICAGFMGNTLASTQCYREV